ncbi:MAG: hypothetical protein IJX53_01270 [Clostridia bacterium]|nr:hypothetical protein [Clostridia bacterium]
MFTQAKPIWIKGRSNELNVQTAFTCTVDSRPGLTLRLTGATYYRVFVDGRFVHYGPARAARGCARVDEIALPERGPVALCIEVMGYRCNSLSTANQPSYLQAEIVVGGEVIAFTGRDFVGRLPGTHLQKVQRFSKQRHFGEVWDFRTRPTDPALGEPAETEVLPLDLRYLPRAVAMPEYRRSPDAALAMHGTTTVDPEAKVKLRQYSGTMPDGWGFFDESEIEHLPFPAFQRLVQHPSDTPASLPLTLKAGEYAIMDLRQVYAGFFSLALTANAESDFILAFSEASPEGRFEFVRINMHAVIEYLLAPGAYDHLSFEPYTARYAMIAVTAGEIELRSLSMVELEHPLPDAPSLGDAELDKIYTAARRSFAHNAVDIFFDCPSRERAGWLCDSYYTAQAEYHILGKVDVEPAFLENFLLRPDETQLGNGTIPTPQAVLPMCYPGDPNGEYIPQWAMWYVLELEQYLNHRAPDADRARFKPLIDALMAWFAQYENEDGLLEKLPGWNFVEWSKANQWTQEVNYPTNMLYAETLECCDKIWHGGETARANAIRAKVRELSFDGEFFRDHAYRDETGKLVNYPDISEVCQYYAFRFGVADRDDPRYARLMHTIRTTFGPHRTDALPHIEKANALMGVYLRLELLQMWDERDLLLSDIRGFFGGMADRTGTLWEYTAVKGSLDHGFASYAAVALWNAVKG